MKQYRITQKYSKKTNSIICMPQQKIAGCWFDLCSTLHLSSFRYNTFSEETARTVINLHKEKQKESKFKPRIIEVADDI
jgi:hypothetical protein